MKRFLFIGLSWVVSTVVTAQFQFGKTVTINKPVFEDLYITGGNIIINAPVHGDLVIAGGTITINDTVTNDILLAGGDVRFNGYVGDDLRCAGGNLQVLKSVAGDVVITGGTIFIHEGSVIGNLISGGGEVTIDGTVTGNVKSASGNLVLNGDVMKSMDCRGGKITINGKVRGPAILAATENITIGDRAFFNNAVRYWAPNDVNFKQSVSTGKPVYDPSVRINYARWYYLGFTSLVGLLWYCGMVFVMIMIIQYLFSATMKKAGDAIYRLPWKSLGWGLIFFVGVPLATIVAFITIVGVPVGLLLATGYMLLLLLATVIVSVVSANWLNNRTGANWKYWRMVFAGLGMFILLKIIGLTPFFGWIIMAFLVCIAFGAILININWKKREVSSAM